MLRYDIFEHMRILKAKLKYRFFEMSAGRHLKTKTDFWTVFSNFLSKNESVPLTFVEVKQDRQVGP